ncbi:hypothetical protein BDV98DRAFT_555935 [Pterulicium gracile]|uniref:Uncharacterized protein n=1 Tax=Pterulicium gracile TaxID=1884261 RepID=A0A5C3Q609_9AGAR|nr:hypothetical protein BDV98DRAFT_555935 [Pterula gracilis]
MYCRVDGKERQHSSTASKDSDDPPLIDLAAEDGEKGSEHRSAVAPLSFQPLSYAGLAPDASQPPPASLTPGGGGRAVARLCLTAVIIGLFCFRHRHGSYKRDTRRHEHKHSDTQPLRFPTLLIPTQYPSLSKSPGSMARELLLANRQLPVLNAKTCRACC